MHLFLYLLKMLGGMNDNKLSDRYFCQFIHLKSFTPVLVLHNCC